MVDQPNLAMVGQTAGGQHIKIAIKAHVTSNCLHEVYMHHVQNQNFAIFGFTVLERTFLHV